jgi:hypothetical protein
MACMHAWLLESLACMTGLQRAWQGLRFPGAGVDQHQELQQQLQTRTYSISHNFVIFLVVTDCLDTAV